MFSCYNLSAMNWLIITVLIFAQQPVKTPESQGGAERNNAKSARVDKADHDSHGNTTQPTPISPPPTVGPEAKGNPGTAANAAAASNQQTNEEDRAIQRKLEWFTGILAAVGFLQLVVMFLTWLVYRRQAGEMRRSRHEMRRQRHVMYRQYRVMRDQIAQMESAGKQTAELINQASTQSGLMALAGTHTETLAAQAEKQSKLTQRQLDLANRPWICIDSVTAASDFTFRDSGDAVIFVAYQIRNVGHSVAQHLQPWVEPIITGITDPREVKDRISTQLRKPIDSAFDHGQLIFPGQVLVNTYPVLIRKEVLEDAIKNSPFKETEDKRMPCLGLELFICFDYQSTLDQTVHHQTQSMYTISRPGPNGMAMGTFFPSQKVYKANEIVMGYKGYGAYAD